MTDTNAPPKSQNDRTQQFNLVPLLDRLAAFKTNLCFRWLPILEGDQAFCIASDRRNYTLDDASKVDRSDLIEVAEILEDMFRMCRLPLVVEHPIQWDVVSVRSGEFEAQHTEDAIALLSVLVCCLEARGGVTNG